MEQLSTRAKPILNDIIRFWKGLHDEEHGGFFGYMSYELKLDKKAVKGCILNSRILWFFSEAAMLTGREDLKKEAIHAYRFLREYCVDREHGGMFWSVNYDGSVFDATKHTYNQGFAIYALSSYYRLTGDEEAIELALELFGLVEEKCFDGLGYLEAFNAKWEAIGNEKLSENGVLADKTMNTLLHVFEGYAGLYMATADETVKAAMKKCLDIFMKYIYDDGQQRQLVFFDKDYRSIIDLYSYGHDIETSWLLYAGTELLNDAGYSCRIRDISVLLAESVYRHAYAKHSLANECDRSVVDKTRVWWVQAEAVLGFLNAYQLTNDEKYGNAAADILGFIEEYMIDRREGSEWFWCTDENGSPIGKPIAEPWKCPYHNGRMCMEIIKRKL